MCLSFIGGGAEVSTVSIARKHEHLVTAFQLAPGVCVCVGLGCIPAPHPAAAGRGTPHHHTLGRRPKIPVSYTQTVPKPKRHAWLSGAPRAAELRNFMNQ